MTSPGLGDTAALELLSVAGLINYFGRWTDLREVQLSPVLLQKGRTKLALYGLGNIRDERLHRIFTNDNVRRRASYWNENVLKINTGSMFGFVAILCAKLCYLFMTVFVFFLPDNYHGYVPIGGQKDIIHLSSTSI